MDSEKIAIYRPRIFANVLNGVVYLLLVFLLVTLPLLVSGEPIESNRWMGVGGFWLFGLAVAILQFGFRLEVGPDYVKTYFLAFLLSEASSQNVQAMHYGSLYMGGLGFGKGLTYRVRANRKIKTYSIGERFYGEKAIQHAKRVLEAKN